MSWFQNSIAPLMRRRPSPRLQLLTIESVLEMHRPLISRFPRAEGRGGGGVGNYKSLIFKISFVRNWNWLMFCSTCQVYLEMINCKFPICYTDISNKSSRAKKKNRKWHLGIVVHAQLKASWSVRMLMCGCEVCSTGNVRMPNWKCAHAQFLCVHVQLKACTCTTAVCKCCFIGVRCAYIYMLNW